MTMIVTESQKQDALQDIVGIADRHQLTNAEIVAALDARHSAQAHGQAQKSLLSRLFSYLGGAFVFSGIAVYVSMFWPDFPPAVRVLVTLGTGFALYLLALKAHRLPRFAAAETPLFLASSFFEAGGLFVLLDEYSTGGDPQMGILYICGVMLVQQVLTWLSVRNGVLVFTALFFYGGFFYTLFDMVGIDYNLNAVVMGASFLFLATALGRSLSQKQAGFWHLVGAVALLEGFYDIVDGTAVEVAFLGVAALLTYVSITVKSRLLLTVSVLAIICYIGHFSFEYFADSGLWPLALIVTGGLFIWIGSLAVKLHNKYIKAA